MQLKLIRYVRKGKPSTGELLINGKHFCFTLEDQDRKLHQDMTEKEIRQAKVDGRTAIPFGIYPIKLTYSPKFKRMLPIIEGVKGFVGIRIHRGNFQKDTRGCPLVGYLHDTEEEGVRIFESTQAEIDLVKKFEKSKDKTHTIEICKSVYSKKTEIIKSTLIF